MGGYGSGRRKTSAITTQCINIDTSDRAIKKALRKPGKKRLIMAIVDGPMQKQEEDNLGLLLTIETFSEPSPALQLAARTPIYGKMQLNYIAVRQDTKESTTVDMWIPLVTTPCNYGGRRWWMIAPCCGARVRSIFIPPGHTYPICRSCANIHYLSQLQSDIERHKTRERYLLANYGYMWAAHEYERMKEHYLEVTPELEYIRQRSILTRELEIMKRLISTQRMMIRTDLRILRSLKSEEDRGVYVDHLVKQRGQRYMLDLVHVLKESTQLERDIRGASDEVLEKVFVEKAQELPASPGTDEEREPLRLDLLIARKEQVEQDLEELALVA